MAAAAVAMKPVIKVAAICGSLRKGSYNRGLLRSAIQICDESIQGMKIEYIEIEPLPFINTDLEVDGTYPPVVESFRQKILEADSILFGSPEYNYSVSPPLKNAIDWASRPPNVWADKPAAIVSAAGSLGGARSQYHLRQIGVFLDLHFINKPEFFLNAFQPPKKFETDGTLIDPEAKERLKKVLLSLQAFTLRLQRASNHSYGAIILTLAIYLWKLIGFKRFFPNYKPFFRLKKMALYLRLEHAMTDRIILSVYLHQIELNGHAMIE